MADETIRRSYLYRQVADRLADEIRAGVHAPGTLLPSETELMTRFRVSRPTARAAIGQLREAGLVVSRQGYGSIVRGDRPTAALDHTITLQDGGQYAAYDQYTDAEEPHITRTHLQGTEADLLQRADEAAFQTDRLLDHTSDGQRAHLRVLIPFATAEDHPAIAENPALTPAEIYAQLAQSGPLRWQERISARPATPDDRASLTAADWLLICRRITYRATTGQPLILETLTADAASAHLTHRITAQTAQPAPETS
jgi:GntR family transcriptional regulator